MFETVPIYVELWGVGLANLPQFCPVLNIERMKSSEDQKKSSDII